MDSDIEDNTLENKMMTTNSTFKNKFKRIVAREFIYIVLISIVCFLIYKIGEYRQNSYYIEIDNKQKILDSLPQHQLLWYKLKKHNLYNKNYENFKKDYKNTEEQIVLFNLVSNNLLYTKGLSDFRVKYFRKESVLDDLYNIYYNEYRLNEENIQNQGKEFWIDLRKKEEEFKKTLKVDSTCVKIYSSFVKQGYKHSIEGFKKLIFEPYEVGLDTKEIDNLEKDINKVNPRYSETAININIFLIILFFPFRYLIIGLIWSIKQVKNKNSVI
jgi:hypothetical protein